MSPAVIVGIVVAVVGLVFLAVKAFGGNDAPSAPAANTVPPNVIDTGPISKDPPPGKGPIP